MEKMKISVGTMVALVLVVTAVSGLVINFGMVQAGGPEEVEVEYELKLKQNGDDVDVEVKAKGLENNIVFTVRAYTSGVRDCSPGLLAVIDSENSGGNGKIDISGTISTADVDDVGSVSIRSPGTPGDLVQCFRDTTRDA